MARTASILLLGGDYAERLSALYGAVVDAKADREREDASPKTLLEDPIGELSEAYYALKDEAEAEAREARRFVRMEAVGRSKWRTLKADHPPRVDGDTDTVQGDRLAGVNSDSVEDDLVFACMVEPAFTSRAAFDEWADTLSQGEWQTLVVKAWELVNGARFDPKPLPASLTRSTEQS